MGWLTKENNRINKIKDDPFAPMERTMKIGAAVTGGYVAAIGGLAAYYYFTTDPTPAKAHPPISATDINRCVNLCNHSQGMKP